MNTISYRELKRWYTDNEEAIQLAKDVFGDKQPTIYETGFYSSPSWNWGYRIGLVRVADNKYTPDDTTYEVITQFGVVKAARAISLPRVVIEHA